MAGETAKVVAPKPESNGGTAPGVPIVPRMAPEPVGTAPAMAESKVCVPCLIARGVVLVLISAALITMLIMDRRSKAAAAKAAPSE